MDAKNEVLIEMYQIYLYQNEGSMDLFPPTKIVKACLLSFAQQDIAL